MEVLNLSFEKMLEHFSRSSTAEKIDFPTVLFTLLLNFLNWLISDAVCISKVDYFFNARNNSSRVSEYIIPFSFFKKP